MAPDQIISQFAVAKRQYSFLPLKIGHLHDTYLVCNNPDSEPCYVLQRINTNIFQDVPKLMHNISLVLKHIKKRSFAEQDADLRPVELVTTEAGEFCYVDQQEEYWRLYSYVSNSASQEICPSKEAAFEAAKLCGRLQRYVLDLEPSQIYDTIPNFHSTIFRFKQFENALAIADPKVLEQVKPEIDFAMERKEFAQTHVKELEAGNLNKMVIHSDLKFNNVLFDKTTGKAVFLVDHDTYMVNSILFDFGDMVRATASTAAEDEPDLAKVEFNIDLYQALAKGFVSELKENLNSRELELMPLSPLMIGVNLGVRFLTDYLNGSKYFKIDYPEHNLNRSRNQFKLVKSMEKYRDQMKKEFD